MYKTQEEFNKGFIRMMDSLRPNSEHKGEMNCNGIECKKCFLDKCYLGLGGTFSNVFEVMQSVWDWNQAHPLVTNRGEYKKIFGVDSEIDCYRGTSHCPFKGNGKECKDCNCQYYKDAEYHAPNKE